MSQGTVHESLSASPSSPSEKFSVEAPYILHALPNQTVFDFFSQQHNKLCHFISDIMDFFMDYFLVFGWRRPATNLAA